MRSAIQYLAIFGSLLCPSAFATHLDPNANVFDAPRKLSKHAVEDVAPRSPESCEHGPYTRSCWTGNYGIWTDADLHWPDTGVYRQYTFEITNKTLAPDGFARPMQVINGQYPGPTIEANWGDIIQVTVINRLTGNGTGIHWHGARQLHSNEMDGTGSVTECPIPPGASKVYTFRATQYGSSWYHSHYSVQYGDGVLGGIVVHGPATRNYDVDLGVFPMTDWFHTPLAEVNAAARHGSGPPTSDNILINGTMTSAYGGKRPVTMLTPGKTHRLRLMNTGINNWIHASLDNHPFTVIAADFVPIEPFETNELSIGIGQRYDVLITANQNANSSYWFRVGTGGWCDAPNLGANSSRGIFRYIPSESSPLSPSPELLASSYYDEPTSLPFAPLMRGCWDEQRIVPVQRTEVPRNVPKAMEVGFTATNASADGVMHWLIDGVAMKDNPKWPTLVRLADGVRDFPRRENVYRIGEEGGWQYWVIQQSHAHPTSHIPHPIHLHGHDFFILGSVTNATWAGDISTLNFSNPPRRDSTTLPSNGYVVLAFESDNPGVWLMHCHIPFHVGQGFALQFAEREEEIVGTIGRLDDMRRECGDWRAFQESYHGVNFEFEETIVR